LVPLTRPPTPERCSPCHSTSTPSAAISLIIPSVADVRDVLEDDGPQQQAARIGRAAFLLPAGLMVPDSG
jgi:hypothetical protein